MLEDAYVPRYQLQNPALRNWFNETDAWWFDNVRQNIERLSSPVYQSGGDDARHAGGQLSFVFYRRDARVSPAAFECFRTSPLGAARASQQRAEQRLLQPQRD